MCSMQAGPPPSSSSSSSSLTRADALSMFCTYAMEWEGAIMAGLVKILQDGHAFVRLAGDHFARMCQAAQGVNAEGVAPAIQGNICCFLQTGSGAGKRWMHHLMPLLQRWGAKRDREDDCIRVQLAMKDGSSMVLTFYTADVGLQFWRDGHSETTVVVYIVEHCDASSSAACCRGECGDDDDNDDWDSATSDDDDDGAAAAYDTESDT